jgi:pimeloyl-ACP methyl ester carboxylesterase
MGLALIAVGTRAPLAAQRPAPPGRLVEVHGAVRHLHCTGSGSPTVVLESGSADFSVIWALVQPGVARFTRTCSYDRAGFAWSDPGPAPRTPTQLASELHDLLARAGERAPLVMVGHSYGGILVRAYALRYPTEVAGMVLVDTQHENHRFRMNGTLHAIRDDAAGVDEPAPQRGTDTVLVRLRQAGVRSTRPPAALEDPLDRLPAAAQSVWTWARGDSAFRIAADLEMQHSASTFARIHAMRQVNPTLFGALPLIVLARSYAPAAELDPLSRERREQQVDLAKMSSLGEIRFARNSGHNIEIEAPEEVVTAIRDVVTQVRRSHGGP